MNKRKIPSEEEFLQAKANMRENDRGLSDLSDRVVKRFCDRGVYKCFTLYSPRVDTFFCYIFFEFHRQIANAEQSDFSCEISFYLKTELTSIGRLTSSFQQIAIEFDSHENICQTYNGDYFLRLR